MEAFIAFDSQPTRRTYSSLYGTDPEALDILLSLHAGPQPRILDCTYNLGKMWRGIRDKYLVETMDIDPKYATTYVGDFRQLRAVVDGHFDVLVFDPPHLPVHAASANSSGIWRDQYGLTGGENTGRDGDNVSELFAPFFQQARETLRPNGIVLCKIVDMVHNHRYQWQHVDLIMAAREAQMTPCDLLVKTDPCGGNLKSSLWKNVLHLRRNHCYWIVVRNGKCCERR